jgi:hypothetical protein
MNGRITGVVAQMMPIGIHCGYLVAITGLVARHLSAHRKQLLGYTLFET